MPRAGPGAGPGRCRPPRRSAGLPTSTCCPATTRADAATGHGGEPPRPPPRHATPRAARPSTTARARGCSERASAAATSAKASSPPARELDVLQARPPLGQGAGLVEDHGAGRGQRLEDASAEVKSAPSRAPRPVATTRAVGVARPRAQGQAMTSTETVVVKAKSRRGSGPHSNQASPGERGPCRGRPGRRPRRPGRPAAAPGRGSSGPGARGARCRPGRCPRRCGRPAPRGRPRR